MMKMENNKEVELQQDWSNMSVMMLEQICKLLTIPNQIRFSTACKTWLSSNTSKKAYHWIPDAPWLVDNDNTNAQFQVISTTDKQSYQIYKPFEPSRSTSIVGSCKGWLILRSDLKLFILNLFSKFRLNLPPLSGVSCLMCSKGTDCFSIHTPFAFAMSMCPKMNPSSVALVTFNGDLGWCKVGDNSWKHHSTDDFYANVAFHDDKLYAVDRDGEKVNIFKYDEGVLVQVGTVQSTKPSEHFPSGPIDMRVYLVECGGKVLVVKRIIDDTKVHMPTKNFVVLVVEENSSISQLKKVHSLDEHILFVSNSSIKCVDAKYCPKFRHGCIYFTCYTENTFSVELGEFSVADRTRLNNIPLLSPYMLSPVWMLPRFPFDCDCEVCTSTPYVKPKKMKKTNVLR